ncbi:Ppx/GppA phosphatase family protein [Clostridium vitabionis]|uniref:Ppx/GppA phosphatase family protein n=1 Tax=Clostridium vitabionis TaxID=2784388 RepID=UPI00188B3850|nr:HD domain-containing protein [Clostridium vitabionis]
MAGKMFAAIDVGSFDSELVIYEISRKNGIREVDHVRFQLPVGRDTYNTGTISQDMLREICELLDKFRGIMDSYRVDDYRAYACSALREARNCSIVLDQIRVRTGLRVRTANNSELRLLSLKGVASRGDTFDKILAEDTAVLDVGFGSSQLSLYREGRLISTENLSLGVLRISEMMMRWNIRTADIPETICEMISNELGTYSKIHLGQVRIRTLIATGESINYIIFRGMHENPDAFRRITVSRDGRFTASEFTELCGKIGHMTAEQMDEILDISSTYAAVLAPSALIFEKVIAMTGAEKVWTPGINLCDGVAADWANEKKLVLMNHDFEEDILSTARNMAMRYCSNMDHVLQVEQMAAAIFDASKAYHGLDRRTRLLIRIAAILHDCGKFVSISRSSENSYRLIMSTELIGLSHLERELVANVVRYNTQPYTYDDIQLESFVNRWAAKSISGMDIRITIARLAAILRVANSADRSHCQKLRNAHVSVRGGKLIITTDYPGNLMLEKISVGQKAEFFGEIYGLTPVLRQRAARR